MHIFDKLDGEIRLSIPIVLYEDFIKEHESKDIHITTTQYSSYIRMKPEVEKFKGFLFKLVCSQSFDSYNDAVSDVVSETMRAVENCIGIVLASCRFGPREPKDDVLEEEVYNKTKQED